MLSLHVFALIESIGIIIRQFPNQGDDQKDYKTGNDNAETY